MRYALVYGGIAGAVVIAVALVVVAGDLPSHFETRWFGYLVMLAALSLIFVGVRRYRDVECGGVIDFGRAFKLGLGMALVAAGIYIVGWELFLGITGRDFMAEYSASMIDGMRANGEAPVAIAKAQADMSDFAVRHCCAIRGCYRHAPPSCCPRAAGPGGLAARSSKSLSTPRLCFLILRLCRASTGPAPKGEKQ